MIKRIFLTLVGLVIVAGALAGIKALQIHTMIAQGAQAKMPPTPVSSAPVTAQSWESTITAVGSLSAVQGVTVTAELAGKVVDIRFTPGASVKAGDLLLQQDVAAETAQLRAAEAAASLARINLARATKLLARKMISQSEHDSAAATWKQAAAQADAIRAVIAKKTIRAPFTGRLGIRLAQPGQFLDAGQAIVSLQSLDPIFVDFQLPQQELGRIRTGLQVRVTTDALADATIEGRLTTINPEVDSASRNVRVQGTLANADERLRPGMYVNVAVVLPKKKQVLAIPATAVLHAPYSDSVFVIERPSAEKEQPAKKEQPAGLVLRQQFIRQGEKRGDFVEILSGLKEGEQVASTGVFKLRNGLSVVVNNKVTPKFHLHPQPAND